MKHHCIMCGSKRLEHDECFQFGEVIDYPGIMYHCLDCEAEWVGSCLGNAILYEGIGDASKDIVAARSRFGLEEPDE